MELLALLGGLAALAFLVSPIVSLILGLTLRKRLAAVEVELASRKNELRWLYEELKSLRAAGTPPAERPDRPPEPEPTRAQAPAAEPTRAEPTSAQAPAAEPTRAEAPSPSERPGPDRPRPEASPPLAPAPARASASEPIRPSFEQRLATQFTRIGAGALLLGVLYFFKYAADNEWIGPAGRVLLGALFGVAILVTGEIVRPKTHPAFIHALAGVGIAVLYISAWASSARYALVETHVAFTAGTVVLFVGAALAHRYRGEAVLLLVLIAGFLNPVLLSTGQDRPFALFSYLFVLTGVALVVSVLRSMRFSLALAILGVAVLFGGWHDRYFRVHDLTGDVDLPLEEARGAYFELSARIVPLVFVALFTCEWLATAFALARREVLPRLVKPVAVVALVFAHAALASLLHDRPIALGVSMIFIAASSVAALRGLQATRYLLIPMLAAFLFLAAHTHGTPRDDQAVLLALLGVWCAVYVVVFLKDGFREATNLRRAATQAGVALACFAAVASWMLLEEDRFLAVGALLFPWSAVVVAISVRTRTTGLALAGLIVSFLPFAAAAHLAANEGVSNLPFLGLALAWGATHVAGILSELARRLEGHPVSLVVLAASGLAALALGLLATPAAEPTLRALLTAGVGASFLGLAVHVRTRRPDLSAWVRLLAAVAVALFAPAIAFALSGATVTVAWAVLSAVSLVILAQARDRTWLAVSIALVIATTVRVFFVDVAGVEAERDLFEASRGRLGVLAVRPFFNPRAYALGGSGLAFLAGAALLAREAAAIARSAPRLFLGAVVLVAWGLITIGCVLEVRALWVDLPAPPELTLDPEEFEVFMESVRAAEAAGAHLRAMATTVVLALVAMLLLGLGFAARDVFHRYLGLALFTATLAKLVLWDVWNLARIYQIVVLGVVGALLLGSGFLYARLKALFQKSDAPVALLLASSLLLAGEARADAPKPPLAPVHLFRHRAEIDGVTGPGDHRIRVSSDLLMKSLADTPLADLRVVDGDGREVPFLVRVTPPLRVLGSTPGRLLDPGHIDGGAFRATFELPPNTEHCHVALELAGEAPYLRRTRVETGHTPEDLQTISEGAIIYAAEVQGVRARSSTIRYPVSTSRYVRITLQPDPNAAPTEIYGGVFSCGGEDALPRFLRLPLTVLEVRQNTEERTTEIDLDAGGSGVPLEKLAVRVTTPEFERRVRVYASAHRTAWPLVGSGVIYRVGREGPESTALELQTTRRRYLRLVIEDGSNAPLAIPQVEGVYAERDILFRASSGGSLALYVGNAEEMGGGPLYDFAQIVARRSEPLELIEARLGALVDNPAFGQAPPRPEPFTERHRGIIGVALTVCVLGLALWAIRLIKSSS